MESIIVDPMNYRFIHVFFASSLLGLSHSFAYNKECWNESKTCLLTGSLELRTFPSGRSNRKGEDLSETHLYLKLVPPIIVHFKNWDNDNAPSTELIDLMQVAGEFDSHLFKIAKNKTNHVTVKTKIFGQQTGHHHTKFLIDASNNIVVDKRGPKSHHSLLHCRQSPHDSIWREMDVEK